MPNPNNSNAPATVGEVALRVFSDIYRSDMPFDLQSSVIRHCTALIEQFRMEKDGKKDSWGQGFNSAVILLDSKIDDMLK